MKPQATQLLWVGEKDLTESGKLFPADLLWQHLPPLASTHPTEWPAADLTLVAWDPHFLPTLRVWRAQSPEASLAFFGTQWNEADLRESINHLGAIGFLSPHSSPEDLAKILKEAAQERRARQEREDIRQKFASRNRELEKLTEILEKTVVERTSNLEESTREEKDKVAKERQLIRFLSEISAQSSTEDILRVLRRELRRFHKIQNLVVALREGPHSTEFLSFRGDQISRQVGNETWPAKEADPRELQQFFANHFGRPFNRTLFFPMNLHLAGDGLLGVEYSMMEEEEIGQISDLLEERMQAVGMAVERLFLEDSLRRFASRWERTFDGFRDPIAVIDSSMRVLRGNRSFSTGISRKLCHQAFAGSDEPCEDCPVAVAPEAARTLEGSVKVGRRMYRMSSWPVQETGASRIGGRVTHYSDITESRELYLRLLQHEKMSAIGSLAGNIAHELNNPLTGIRSLAQALRAEAQDEGTLKEDLSQIENAAKRCQAIIRHLLDFTNTDEKPSVVASLDEIIESTLPLLKTPLRRHRVEMILTARQAKIRVDPHLLQQVIFNLVNNACQAMTEPGRLGLITRAHPEHVELKIVDTGPGIPLEMQNRLFEPFFTTKKEGEGTGLGLSTSKAIVEKYGGTIEFKSEPGQGTEFTLRFPKEKNP